MCNSACSRTCCVERPGYAFSATAKLSVISPLPDVTQPGDSVTVTGDITGNTGLTIDEADEENFEQVLALNLRGMPFSITAAIGFIALSGVAVLDARLTMLVPVWAVSGSYRGTLTLTMLSA